MNPNQPKTATHTSSRYSLPLAGMLLGAQMFLAAGMAQAVTFTFIPGETIPPFIPGETIPPFIAGETIPPLGDFEPNLEFSQPGSGPTGSSSFSEPATPVSTPVSVNFTTIVSESNLSGFAVGDSISLDGRIDFSGYTHVNTGNHTGGDYHSLEFSGSGGDSFLLSGGSASHFNVWFHDSYDLTQETIDASGAAGLISPGEYDLVEVNADFDAVFENDQLVSGYESSVGLVLDPGFLSIGELNEDTYQEVFNNAFSSDQVVMAHGGLYTPNGAATGVNVLTTVSEALNVNDGGSFDNVGEGLEFSFAVGSTGDEELQILAGALPFDFGIDYVEAATGLEFVPISVADITPYDAEGQVDHTDAPIYFVWHYDDEGMTLAQELALQIFHFNEEINGWEILESEVNADENWIAFYASDFSPHVAGFANVPESPAIAFLLGGLGLMLMRRRNRC